MSHPRVSFHAGAARQSCGWAAGRYGWRRARSSKLQLMRLLTLPPPFRNVVTEHETQAPTAHRQAASIRHRAPAHHVIREKGAIMDGAAGEPLLEIKNLSIALPKGADRRFAVEDVSLSLRRGELLCVVGESGSGKSVMTSAIMNDIAKRLSVDGGEIIFDGRDVLKLPKQELNALRGDRISMIYQEPMAALNPSIRIGEQVDEVFALHRP
ncbi:MAG: ATP-binding cassette domain-containing protein, partial [Pseudomonadota bacterium]